MKKTKNAVLALVLTLAVFGGYLLLSGSIGVSQSRLAEDVRSAQAIAEDWDIVGVASEDMAAYLSCPADRSDHTFSVYVNRPGLSFGYFFRAGGRLSGVEDGIMECTIENCPERAFLSLNHVGAVRMETNAGTVTELDPAQPFAMVLPVHEGAVTFYDGDGNAIPVWKNPC